MSNRYRSRWSALVSGSGALVVLALGGSGCSDAQGFGELGSELESPGTSEEAMNGALAFPDQSCVVNGTDYRPVLRNGATIAFNHLGSSNMAPCLAQHSLSATNGDSAETIVSKMKEAVSTQIVCYPTSNGIFPAEAPVRSVGQAEDVNFNPTNLPNESADILAAILLHEVGHNKGYEHSTNHGGSEEQWTVNEQLAACSIAMSGQAPGVGGPPPVPFANGLRQDQLVRSTFLGQVGGIGGSVATRTCYSGGFARGFVGRSGARIDALSLLCTDRNGNGSEAMGQVGGTGGGAFTLDCGHGQLLVGMVAYADNLLNGLSPVCATASSVRAGTPQNLVGRELGTRTGSRSVRVCPAGKAVKTAWLRTGSLVDQLKLECEDAREGFNQTQTSLTAVGNAVGTTYRERCPVGSVMTGIGGEFDGSFILRLGGTCAEVQDDGETVSFRPARVTPICDSLGCRGGGTSIPLPGQGINSEMPWPTSEEGCPGGGNAVIGMDVEATSSASPSIRRVTTVCANLTTWSRDGGSVTITRSPQHGQGGGKASTGLTCPRRYFMTGWDIRADGQGVQRVQPVCTLAHQSGGGLTCSNRCDTTCTSGVPSGTLIDTEGIIRCLNDCNARCATQ